VAGVVAGNYPTRPAFRGRSGKLSRLILMNILFKNTRKETKKTLEKHYRKTLEKIPEKTVEKNQEKPPLTWSPSPWIEL
jgi:hypothetical protein